MFMGDEEVHDGSFGLNTLELVLVPITWEVSLGVNISGGKKFEFHGIIQWNFK